MTTGEFFVNLALSIIVVYCWTAACGIAVGFSGAAMLEVQTIAAALRRRREAKARATAAVDDAVAEIRRRSAARLAAAGMVRPDCDCDFCRHARGDTGSAPAFKVSPEMNARLAEEAEAVRRKFKLGEFAESPTLPWSVSFRDPFRGTSPLSALQNEVNQPPRRKQLIERLALDIGDRLVFCSWPAGAATVSIPTDGGGPLVLVRTSECVLDDGTDRLAVVYRSKPE
jgi:hypothetical protein